MASADRKAQTQNLYALDYLSKTGIDKIAQAMGGRVVEVRDQAEDQLLKGEGCERVVAIMRQGPNQSTASTLTLVGKDPAEFVLRDASFNVIFPLNRSVHYFDDVNNSGVTFVRARKSRFPNKFSITSLHLLREKPGTYDIYGEPDYPILPSDKGIFAAAVKTAALFEALRGPDISLFARRLR